MAVLLQLLLCSKASSCFRTAAGFWQWSQPLVQAGDASPKYLAMAAWRHLEQAAQHRQGVRDPRRPAFVHPIPKLWLSTATCLALWGAPHASLPRHRWGAHCTDEDGERKELSQSHGAHASRGARARTPLCPASLWSAPPGPSPLSILRQWGTLEGARALLRRLCPWGKHLTS